MKNIFVLYTLSFFRKIIAFLQSFCNKIYQKKDDKKDTIAIQKILKKGGPFIHEYCFLVGHLLTILRKSNINTMTKERLKKILIKMGYKRIRIRLAPLYKQSKTMYVLNIGMTYTMIKKLMQKSVS